MPGPRRAWQLRLRQRLAIGLRLRLSQEGLHLLLGQFVVVAHLSCCSLCGDPRIGTLDSTQNTGDFRQFVSHRSRRRRWNAAQSHAAGRVVRKTGDGLLAPGQTATRGLLDGSVARYKLLLLRRQQFKLTHQARITQSVAVSSSKAAPPERIASYFRGGGARSAVCANVRTRLKIPAWRRNSAHRPTGIGVLRGVEAPGDVSHRAVAIGVANYVNGEG